MNITIDQLIRSRRRTIGLQITAGAKLVIRAPFRANLKFIEKFIQEKQDWIEKNQKKMKERQLQIVKKKFSEGEKFYFLGKEYPLKFSDIKPSSIFFDGKDFLLSQRHSTSKTTLFKNWYKKTAHQIIPERIHLYEEQFSLKHNKIKITSAQRRWGSCSSTNNINFSWRLIMAPLKVIDYVVIHELAHMEHKNHSPRFWKKVKSVMPNYKERNKWLKKKGHELVI